MKSRVAFNKYNVLLVILLCYLLPVLGIVVYGSLIVEDQGLWEVLSLGFFLASFGALAIFWSMASWEKNLSKVSAFPSIIETPLNLKEGEPVSYEDYDLVKRSLEEAQQAQVRLLSEIDHLTEDMRSAKSEKEKMLSEWKQEGSSLEQYKQSLHQELEKQQNLIRELTETVADQKAQLEKKQQQQVQLEAKVGDLTYEIKTILQFAESHAGSLLNHNAPAAPAQPPPPLQPPQEVRVEEFLPLHIETKIQSGQEASQLLKRCLDIAQRITGSQRFGSQIYSFLESPADSFTLDLRRLCDKLRSETGGIVLLYSPRENHLLFANNEVKALTGWSPEKFSQQFVEILVDATVWSRAVGSLSMRSESHAQLQLKAKSGEVIELNATLGMILTGIFRNHALAILYAGSPASTLQNQFKY